jgi:hypothetical protein
LSPPAAGAFPIPYLDRDADVIHTGP